MTRDSFDLFNQPDRGRFGDNETSRQRDSIDSSKLHDFEMVLHYETLEGKENDGAILVSNDGKEAKAVWIPKSLAQIERKNKQTSGTRKNGQAVNLQTIEITIPEWVARDKGLL